MTAKEELDKCQQETDQTLSQLEYWPGREDDGHMYKSRQLFSAVLDRHRSLAKVGNYFQDEILFYTNLIDVIISWLMRELSTLGEMDDIWNWLLSYTYLMGSINYLGAEQALCSVFFSIICFSHRETFYYANYSFSGEAVFRLYRQSYPEERETGWRISSHREFFPNLDTCRQDVLANMDYHGMAFDVSLCDYLRKNETYFYDLDLLVLHENERLKDEILSRVQDIIKESSFQYHFSRIITVIAGVYLFTLHIVRCVFIKFAQRKHAAKWSCKNSLLGNSHKMDTSNSISSSTKIMNHDGYTPIDTMSTQTAIDRPSPIAIQYKVASV